MNPEQNPLQDNTKGPETASPSAPLVPERSPLQARQSAGGYVPSPGATGPNPETPGPAEKPWELPSQISAPQVIGPQQSQTPGAYGSAAFSQSGPTVSPSPISEMSSPVSGGVPPEQPKKRRLRFGKRALAFAVLLVIGLGAGAFAYWQVLNNSPEKVLADALANSMADVLDRKPMQVAGTFKVESKDTDSPYSVSVDLDAKQVDEKDQATATVKFSGGAGFDVSVTATVVVDGSDVVYVKLDNLRKTVDDVVRQNPGISLYATIFDPVIDKIDGRWIKIDQKGLIEAGMVQEEEEKIDKCSEELGKLRISKDDQKQVKDIFKRNQFAIASEELPAEDVDSDSSFHYKLDLNEEAGLHFAKEFIELESFAKVKEACEIEQKDLDKGLEELKKQTEHGDEEVEAMPVFELWVSKSTRRPTKVKVTFDDKEISMENIVTVKLNAQNVHVDIPTDFITIQDLAKELEEVFNSSGTGTLGWSGLREEIQSN